MGRLETRQGKKVDPLFKIKRFNPFLPGVGVLPYMGYIGMCGLKEPSMVF